MSARASEIAFIHTAPGDCDGRMAVIQRSAVTFDAFDVRHDGAVGDGTTVNTADSACAAAV